MASGTGQVKKTPREKVLAGYLYPRSPPSDRCLMRAIHLLISGGRFEEGIAAGERYKELFPGREGGSAVFCA